MPQVPEKIAESSLFDQNRMSPETTFQAPLQIAALPEEQGGTDAAAAQGATPVLCDCGSAGETMGCDKKGDSHQVPSIHWSGSYIFSHVGPGFRNAMS